jgi:hypothetical protein
LLDVDDQSSPIERFYVPLTFFQNYKPLNLEIKCRTADPKISKTSFFVSLVMEKELESFIDSICTVIVNYADFDPLPYETKSFNCIFTTHSEEIRAIYYHEVDLRDEQSLSRVV